ncbi:MAG: hypothetical protein ACJA1B_001160 [Polaribacter sp.]|jgi:hypothetical protein
MEEIIQQQNSSIATIFNDKLLPVFINRVTNHQEATLKIASLQKKLIAKKFTKKEEELAITALNIYKKELELLVSSCFSTLETANETLLFNDYYSSLDAHLETIDENIVRSQNKERFFSEENDSKLLKFRKEIKRSLFNTSKIPLKTANIFRKTKKEFDFWSQNIPFKNATKYYFKDDLINDLSEVIDVVHKEISEITSKYWQIDAKIDDEIQQYLSNDEDLIFSDEFLENLNAIPSLESRIETHTKSLQEIYEASVLKYTNALYKTDTMELSASFFKEEKTATYHTKVTEKVAKKESLWQNTYTVFKSDWELDIEIFIVIFKLMMEYATVENTINSRTGAIQKEIDTIRKYIETVKNTVNNADKDPEIKSTITAEIKNINKSFKKIITNATTIITNQELQTLINKFEEKTLDNIKAISTKRAISTDNNYAAPTNPSSINYISPYELIIYESWPILDDKIKEAKVGLTVKVNRFIDDINALPQVFEFNLESALSLFENVSQENTPKKVALDGLQRSIEKVDGLKNALINFSAVNSEIIEAGIQKFNKSILALTDTENIIQVRLTIAKAKSIEKSKLVKEKVVNTVTNFIPIAIGFFTLKHKQSFTYVSNLLVRTGLYKVPSNDTTDLVDFLKQAEKALDALPYVYQRLFRSETLQNEELFIGRKEGIDTLETAFDTFNNNQYGATIIIGERGAGKTSLIHYYLNKKKAFKKAVFLSPNRNCSKPNEFIDFLNTSFSKDFKTLEEWIQFFNNGNKITIVLENIQYLYFRKVNGFRVLNQLSTLISATKNSVFWIVTSAKYAFQYLDKSIQISELFAFTVELSEIDKATMTEALIKRHKISGYNLFFEKPPAAYLTKKFLKSSVDVQQEILREEFFTDINKIAKSNFKIAFMYWIRAAEKVEGSTIYMRSLKNIDTSFLNKIAPVKLLLINSILLQERLNSKEIVELSGLDEQRTLNIVNSLYVNGILTIEDGEYYVINILLFRQVTALLKSKNVIH